MAGMEPVKGNSLNDIRNFISPFLDNFFGKDVLSLLSPIQDQFALMTRELDDRYIVEAKLPGFRPEDVEVNYQHNYLTIRARSNGVQEQQQESYVYQQCSYGEVHRQIYVENVDGGRMQASFCDGVLTVILPKRWLGNNTNNYIDI